jgi:flagellar basal body rod protein FlgC
MNLDSIAGIRQNIEMFNAAAGRIQDPEKADMPTEIVNMMVAKHGVQASLVALKATIDMNKSLIDIFA